MHNIYDIISRCNQKQLYLTHSYKLSMRNAIFEVIDQHKNAWCPMQSFERIATLAQLAHYTMFSPQNLIQPHDVLKDAPWKDQSHITQTIDLKCLKTIRIDMWNTIHMIISILSSNYTSYSVICINLKFIMVCPIILFSLIN